MLLKIPPGRPAGQLTYSKEAGTRRLWLEITETAIQTAAAAAETQLVNQTNVRKASQPAIAMPKWQRGRSASHLIAHSLFVKLANSIRGCMAPLETVDAIDAKMDLPS